MFITMSVLLVYGIFAILTWRHFRDKNDLELKSAHRGAREMWVDYASALRRRIQNHFSDFAVVSASVVTGAGGTTLSVRVDLGDAKVEEVLSINYHDNHYQIVIFDETRKVIPGSLDYCLGLDILPTTDRKIRDMMDRRMKELSYGSS